MLGRLADRTIYFACVNFFSFLTISRRPVICDLSVIACESC